MKFDVGGRCDVGRELHYECRTADFLKRTVETELLGNGQKVDGSLRSAERLYGFIDFLMGRLIETFGLEYVADYGVCVFFDHQRAEHSRFDIGVARSEAPQSI